MGQLFDQSFEFTDNEITQHIAKLHDLQNQGHAMQSEIDRYWLALMMVYVKSPLLDKLSWQAFVLNPAHVFTVHSLPDIGQHVRTLSTRHDSSDMMCRMIQYSLPYIKHNRLTFAKFEDVPTTTLMHLVLIMMGMCLGIFNETSKKPVWRLRFRIVCYMHILLSQGTAYDLYTFCVSNMNLIRIAIVEYFVYYVQTHMPCEYEMLRYLFGMQTNVGTICFQFQININYFRSTYMQTECLDWPDLNEKAHTIIEKCNRICKGKPRMAQRRDKNKTEAKITPPDIVSQALQLPVFEHMSYAMHWQPNLNIATMKVLQGLQKSVQWNLLPANLTRLQCQQLHKSLFIDTNIFSQCIMLHHCLGCRSVGSNSDQLSLNLRTDATGVVSCCVCKTSATVVSINLLGRLVKLKEKKYYLCPHCLGVHEWTSSGREFASSCPRAVVPVTAKPRECLLCDRLHNLNEFTVLDDKLGVMQHLSLCSRHMPWTHQQPGIYNFETLFKAINFKMQHNHHI